MKVPSWEMNGSRGGGLVALDACRTRPSFPDGCGSLRAWPPHPPGGRVAAGHPLTAEAGARVLREGGNAVDAAVAAMLTSLLAEPLLTGLGAGGYLLVAGAGEDPTLLDFFVASPGRGADRQRRAPARAGGVRLRRRRPGLQRRSRRRAASGQPGRPGRGARPLGHAPLAGLAAPAAALAERALRSTASRRSSLEILSPILSRRPRARGRCSRSTGRPLRRGRRVPQRPS